MYLILDNVDDYRKDKQQKPKQQQQKKISFYEDVLVQ